jgi:hypothetical protein
MDTFLSQLGMLTPILALMAIIALDLLVPRDERPFFPY